MTFTVAAGCGESDSDKATAVVESYFDDLADRDYAAACAKTSPRYREILTTFARRNLDDPPSGCEQILGRIGTENDPKLVAAQNQVKVKSVSVEGDRATAKLAGVQRAFLRRSGESWKIDRLDFTGESGPGPAQGR